MYDINDYISNDTMVVCIFEYSINNISRLGKQRVKSIVWILTR